MSLSQRVQYQKLDCNYVFCDLIGDLKSKIGPTSCDKKCCSENPSSSHMQRVWAQD